MDKIYVPDIECESCKRLITKRLSENNIKNFTVNDDSVSVHEGASADEVMKVIKTLGYRASRTPFENKTLGERLRDFGENRGKYSIEYKGINYAMSLFIVLLVVFLLSYFGFMKNIADFIPKYGWWMLYLIISVTFLAIGLWHYFAYKGKVTCMTGMMIGMTFGMQTGMMIGAVVGATNGFFTGSMVGMIAGAVIGAATGRATGVMGWMQGLMAGVMGGTMGPMISVMMFPDHLLIFMPFYMVLNVAIMLGFHQMYFEEVVEKGETVKRKPMDFLTLAALSIIVFAILAAIMMYGPKSALFR